MQSTTRNTSDETSCEARGLHHSLTSGLRTPLSALRATLESLALRFEERDARRPQLDAAIAQVTRIQHNLQSVLDAEQPVPLRPLPCSLQEIVQAAVGALVPEHRGRTLVAVESACARIVVDGPLVSRALSRLIEIGLEQRAQPALLRVRSQSGRALFAVLHGRLEVSPGSIEELAQSIACRDVERMQGSFARRSTIEHAAIFELGFALAAAGEEAA